MEDGISYNIISRLLQHGQVVHMVCLNLQPDAQYQQGFSGMMDTGFNRLKMGGHRPAACFSSLTFVVTSVTNGAGVFTSLPAVVQRST